MKKRGRPKKIESPVRLTVYMPKSELRRLDELCTIYAEERADLVRRVLGEFIVSNKECVAFRCGCGFVVQTTKPSKEISDMIKKHEKECKKV